MLRKAREKATNEVDEEVDNVVHKDVWEDDFPHGRANEIELIDGYGFSQTG